jgi:hypothetical protein
LPTGYRLCSSFFWKNSPLWKTAFPKGKPLWLIITLWPIGSLIAGIICALIPGVSGRVRVLSVAAGLLIGFVCLCLERSEAPALVLIYGVIYAAGFFLKSWS